MKAIAALLSACALALVLTACSTAPKPAAEEPFDQFYARMRATYISDFTSRLAQTTTETPATNAALKEIPGNIFALPPPLLQLPEQKAAREEIEKSGVSPALMQKMLQGQFLTLDEIKELAQKKVSDTNIMKYLRSTGAVYTMKLKQLDELRAVAVSDDLLNYLISSPAQRPTVIYYPSYYPVYRYSSPSYLWWLDHHHYDFHDTHHYDVHHDLHHH